jgi:hypothetical protein
MNSRGSQFCVNWFVGLTATAVFGMLSNVQAADTSWKTATSGSWITAGNWNSGVPNANAAFLTNASASYTVTFDGGAGNSITNVTLSNPSIANTTTLNVNSGVLNITGSQGAGGVVMLSNSVMNVVGGSVANPSVFTMTGGSVITISNNTQSVLTTYDNFESYTNGEILGTAFAPTVTGSPWGRFGAATSGNPTASAGEGVGGSIGAHYVLDWSLGNNGNLVFWFPSPTNLVSMPGISIALFVSNQVSTVSNTTVAVGFEQSDGTIWQTSATLTPVLTNTGYQIFTFTLQSSDMFVSQSGSGSNPFDLTQVLDLRIRFVNGGGTGVQHIALDNFQATSGGSTWNQSAGNFTLGEVGNATVVIGSGGLMTGQSLVPVIGRNDTLFIPATAAASNAVGHLYLEGGTFIYPSRAGNASPLAIGRGQIGIVTVSNGWFEVTSTQGTNGLRIGYTSATSPSLGRGTVEMFGGVVSNTAVLQVGAGQGSSTTFGIGTITVSGGTFYQLGMGASNTTAFVRLPNSSFDSGYLTVNGSGTFISTNAVLVGADASSAGLIQVSGNGQLIVTNIAGNPGLIALGIGGTGTLSLAGGTTVLDRLVATNGTQSIISFASGELDVNVQTVVSNGLLFTVGDGTHTAILNLIGGSHTYNSGLSISSGATLTGAGTINAAVTIAAGGILSPGEGVGMLPINGNVVLANTAVLQYDLGIISDLVPVTGNLTLGGTLNIADTGGFGTGTYTLFSYSGTLTTNGSPTILMIWTTPNPSLVYKIDISTPGLVNLKVTTAPADPFTAWQTHYFPGGGPNSAPNADPDGDGVSNTNEFLAGFNPNNTAAYLHVISIVKQGADINVTYLGANGDNTWSPGIASRTNVLEFTTGTVNGSYSSNNFTTTGQTNILSGGNGLGVLTNMIDIGGATGATRYYRVRVLAP